MQLLMPRRSPPWATHQSEPSSHAIQYNSTDRGAYEFAEAECRHDLRCATGRNPEFPRQYRDGWNDDPPGTGKKSTSV